MKNTLIILFLLLSASVFSSPIFVEEGYFQRDGRWYFLTVADGGLGEITSNKIVGADSASFEIIKFDNNRRHTFYARDKNFVYYRGERVPGADPKTVQTLARQVQFDGWAPVVGTSYIRDKNTVFYRGRRVIGGADPNTFRPINFSHAIDRFGIYYRGSALMYSLPRNYRFLPDNSSPRYVISNNRVFFQENEIRGANAATFEIIKRMVNGIFTIARDKNHIYFNGQKMTELDVNTFEIIAENIISVRVKSHWSESGFAFRQEYEIIVRDKNATFTVDIIGENYCNRKSFALISGELPEDHRIVIAQRERKRQAMPLLTFTEIMPEFPGGHDSLMKFINNNLYYPRVERAMGIQGIVAVRFIVEPDGTLTDIQVVRGVSPCIDAEAMRIVKLMPRWTTGKDSEGQLVRVRLTLPIRFGLR